MISSVSFRENIRNRNRQSKDLDGKWQHDLYRDEDDDSSKHNSGYSNYRSQTSQRAGRGNFRYVRFEKTELLYLVNRF